MFRVHAQIRSFGASFAWAVFRNVRVVAEHPDLRAAMVLEQAKLKGSLDMASLYADPGVAESRRCFKAAGLDPARYRPSQEALLRRILGGKEMYFINSGVDLCNLLSIRYRVPMGLYDLDKIISEVELRIGRAEDIYAALNERDVHGEGKIVLCDGLGPIGSPYVDSKRTAVTSSTKNFLHVVYFCYDGLVSEDFKDMARVFRQFCAGEDAEYSFVKAG